MSPLHDNDSTYVVVVSLGAGVTIQDCLDFISDIKGPQVITVNHDSNMMRIMIPDACYKEVEERLGDSCWIEPLIGHDPNREDVTIHSIRPRKIDPEREK